MDRFESADVLVSAQGERGQKGIALSELAMARLVGQGPGVFNMDWSWVGWRYVETIKAGEVVRIQTD